MKKTLKQIIFPNPPGVTDEENDALIGSFLRLIVVIILTMGCIMLSSWLGGSNV